VRENELQQETQTKAQKVARERGKREVRIFQSFTLCDVDSSPSRFVQHFPPTEDNVNPTVDLCAVTVRLAMWVSII